MTDIYHITHISNICSMVTAGGIWCDALINSRNLAPLVIGYEHIKERRSKREVEVAKGGFLSEYVPFYFCPRSPMLYVIHHGFIQGYQGGQSKVLHLVSSVEVVQAKSLSFFFTDGHAEQQISHQFGSSNDLDKLDWQVINDPIWHNISSDTDRKRRKQAEFLVHNFFPWDLIKEIGVYDEQMKNEVCKVLNKSGCKSVVKVHQNWYY